MNDTKKKLFIVGTNGLPGRYGGWDQLLEHFAINLSLKYDITVYASKFNYDEHPEFYNGVKLVYLPLKANGFQSIPYDILSIFHAFLKGADVILVLGTSGCIFFPLFKFLGLKIILNPDGAEWKRGKWSFWVRSFLKVSERLGVTSAKHLIADNPVIQYSLKSDYGVDSTIIAYGGDHVKNYSLSLTTSAKYDIKMDSYCFKVCRIEPENNIEMILLSFANSGNYLVIVGNWDFSAYGRAIRKKFSMHANIKMLNPIYDQFELNELRSNCRFYIHGHSVGGTNPSLVEAMCLGLCVVAYDVNYNRVTSFNSALYFHDHHQLTSIIKNNYDNLLLQSQIGARLKKLGHENYAWKEIIKKYDEVISTYV